MGGTSFSLKRIIGVILVILFIILAVAASQTILSFS